MKPEMEAVKYFLWLNSDRCSMFFANHALLVEGPTEVALVNKLIADGKIKGGDSGIYVLDCIGKYNIHRFMNLVSHLGIAHSVLHDDDEGKDEHADLNQLILDSKNPLTHAIRSLPGHLEMVLGITSGAADHRKPQHALFQYGAGAIDAAKMKTFCEIVEACLPMPNPGPRTKVATEAVV